MTILHENGNFEIAQIAIDDHVRRDLVSRGFDGTMWMEEAPSVEQPLLFNRLPDGTFVPSHWTVFVEEPVEIVAVVDCSCHINSDLCSCSQLHQDGGGA